MKLIIKRYVNGDIISVENITRYTQREKNPISEESLQEIISNKNKTNDSIQFKQQCFLIAKEQTAPHIFVKLCNTGKIHETACRKSVRIEQ